MIAARPEGPPRTPLRVVLDHLRAGGVEVSGDAPAEESAVSDASEAGSV